MFGEFNYLIDWEVFGYHVPKLNWSIAKISKRFIFWLFRFLQKLLGKMSKKRLILNMQNFCRGPMHPTFWQNKLISHLPSSVDMLNKLNIVKLQRILSHSQRENKKTNIVNFCQRLLHDPSLRKLQLKTL